MITQQTLTLPSAASAPVDATQWRAEIDQHFAENDLNTAKFKLAQLWQAEPTTASAGYLLSKLPQLQPAINKKLALLRSFTVEPIVPLLRAAALLQGINFTVQVGDFNAYHQEIIDHNSKLYQFAPELAILAITTADIAPELWSNFASQSPDQINATHDRVLNTFATLIAQFRANSNAPLIIHSLELPAVVSNGIFDAQQLNGQRNTIRQINQTLLKLASQHSDVYLLDYDELIATHGRNNWRDERKWQSVRLPIAANQLINLAQEWLRYLQPLVGNSCKAIAIDLDNTLWAGVIGEDGLSGIKLSREHAGSAHYQLQQTLLDLYQRGILLTVCSKNNHADALEALTNHPNMLLRPEHFAALRINWQDKAQNIRELAAELNIGIDAIAFLDDNPTERSWVRSQLPTVTVIEVGDNAAHFASAVRNCAAFERLKLSSEDRERGRYYSVQRQRNELQANAGSLADFYYSLQMTATIAPVNAATITRVAQLTQKTNQFNLTTRRYSEAQIAEMMNSAQWQIYSINVKDRFGDNGLVGVVILNLQQPDCLIDTFLLSCRVIGRTVETALLATMAQQAQQLGANRLIGEFITTKKNAPAKDFYQQHGFNCVESQDQRSCWHLDLNQHGLSVPQWINLQLISGE